MLKCRDIVEQASDYLDQDMSLRQRMNYRLHLFMCHHCRRFTRQFSAGVVMLKRLPNKTPDANKIVEIQRQFEQQD